MNSSTDGSAPAGIFSTDRLGAFGYGVGISLTLLLLITTITLISYCRPRWRPNDPNDDDEDGDDTERSEDDDIDVECGGIDEATLKSYPSLSYSQAKKSMRGGSDTAATCCCPICLADYREEDVLRLLPECGHVFHVKCVDPWLRSHPSCPVCRSSPLPTPLAKVVPLAGSGQSS